VIWPTNATKRAFLFRRKNGTVTTRDEVGRPQDIQGAVAPWQMALAELQDPVTYPAATLMRSRLRSWRFY